MKRSEAVRRIYELLEYEGSEVGMFPEEIEDWASAILTRLEKQVGMLPPHNKLAQSMSGSVEPNIGCCMWEPEDD